MASALPAVTDTQRLPLASLLFWLCLLNAAGLYAAIALSPRLVVWGDLQFESARRQVELVNLERQAQQLARVAAALERDPEFVAELARAELAIAKPGGTQIPLPPALGFNPRAPRAVEEVAEPTTPWYLPAARLAATDARLRWRMLGAASGLLLFAFVFLQGDMSRLASVGATTRRVARVVFGRYSREI